MANLRCRFRPLIIEFQFESLTWNHSHSCCPAVSQLALLWHLHGYRSGQQCACALTVNVCIVSYNQSIVDNLALLAPACHCTMQQHDSGPKFLAPASWTRAHKFTTAHCSSACSVVSTPQAAVEQSSLSGSLSESSTTTEAVPEAAEAPAEAAVEQTLEVKIQTLLNQQKVHPKWHAAGGEKQRSYQPPHHKYKLQKTHCELLGSSVQHKSVTAAQQLQCAPCECLIVCSGRTLCFF